MTRARQVRARRHLVPAALAVALVEVWAKTPAAADASASPWAAARAPAPGPAQAIGGYSAGCVQGAAALALVGEGYQVMRPGRRRHFGHPALVRYVRDLGTRVRARRLGVLLVGDLAQPRGGPAPSGHASHQTGLDVDLWYWHPPDASRWPLSRRARDRLNPPAVVSARTGRPTRHFTPRVARLLELAASDPRVARVFVHPGVKRTLCERARGRRGWLAKIRPWWGHNRHFHVRLRCPADSPRCVAQDPLPDGDGCDQLDWWFRDSARDDRASQQQRYGQRVREAPALPEACADIGLTR